MAYIELEHIEKLYQVGEVTITAVSDISFTVDKEEFVVVVGPSGAGKTTVLNILGGMDTATHGTITVDGQTISAYNAKELTAYRRLTSASSFSFTTWCRTSTALENVELATQIAKSPLPPGGGPGPRGPVSPAAQLPLPALRRGAAAGGHRPGPGQEPQAPAVRRAHRRPGLCHRQADPETSPGHLPPAGDDGDRHHPQHRHRPHGRQGHPRERTARWSSWT